jgi:glycerophosphoryl diester phosphodiesterase
MLDRGRNRGVTTSFTLIAHRGYSDFAPENTLAAFDLALERGYPHLELDVQLTSDGTPVVIHDDRLERTTDGTGLLRAHTLEQVRALSAGARIAGPEAETFANEHVPTLDEVLTRYAGRARLHLELKSAEQELAEVVAPLLRAHGWAAATGPDEVPGLTVTSFHVEQLHRSRALLPGVPHGWLLTRINRVDLDLAVLLGLAEICPRADTLTAHDVAAAASRGLRVRAWGVRTEQDLLAAAESGAWGATVNWPDRAWDALANRAP